VTGLQRRLADKRVVICAGPGGVGKTTVSAAVALGLASAGRRVAVVTIDPARRLAEALGLDELGNRPQPVDSTRLAGAGLELRGELSAMMLDVKRTFDELIGRLAPDPRTAEELLANPVYQHLSTAIAGSQEYTAMAKLSELVNESDYETIVLDTPPSRSAVDFLQAPERLIEFLEGRAVSALLRPSGRAARYAGVVAAALRRVTGVGLLDELTAFFRLLGDLLDGFRARATDVQRLLRESSTGFLIVTSGEAAAVDEAIYFAGELDRTGLHRCGVILNRVQPLDPGERDVEETAQRLAGRLDPRLARKVARTHSQLQLLAHRDQASMVRLSGALGNPRPFCLADREAGLQDARGLFELQRELWDAG